jgi:hypothetical protein
MEERTNKEKSGLFGWGGGKYVRKQGDAAPVQAPAPAQAAPGRVQRWQRGPDGRPMPVPEG